MKNNPTVATARTAVPTDYISFLRSVFNFESRVPSIKANDFMLRPGEIILYNPGYTLPILLQRYRTFDSKAAKRGAPNAIEEEISPQNLFSKDFFDGQGYFFCCREDHDKEVSVGEGEKYRLEVLLNKIWDNPTLTMSLEEMILFHLYMQYRGKWTGFPNCTGVTQTLLYKKEEEYLLTFGFDNETFGSIIKEFSPCSLMSEKVIFKEVYRQPAA